MAANNLTQFGVNAQVALIKNRHKKNTLETNILRILSQVTFGETLVIFTIIFLFAMVVAAVYNGKHKFWNFS